MSVLSNRDIRFFLKINVQNIGMKNIILLVQTSSDPGDLNPHS
jgi:hypothetical protein